MREKMISTDNSKHRCLLFIVMLYITAVVSSVLTAHKLVDIFGLATTASVFIFPISFTCADIIAEVYGFKTSRHLLYAGLMCEFLFCMVNYLLIKLPYPNTWLDQSAYNIVIGPLPRVYLASFTAYFVGGFANVYLISRWRILLKGRYFWLRSIGATVIGEGAFTLVAAPIIFFGTIPSGELISLILTVYLVKVAYAFISSGPASIAVSLVRRFDKIEKLSNMLQYNPFGHQHENQTP